MPIHFLFWGSHLGARQLHFSEVYDIYVFLQPFSAKPCLQFPQAGRLTAPRSHFLRVVQHLLLTSAPSLLTSLIISRPRLANTIMASTEAVDAANAPEKVRVSGR